MTTDQLEKEAFKIWWDIASNQQPIKDPKSLAFEAWLEGRKLKPLEEDD